MRLQPCSKSLHIHNSKAPRIYIPETCGRPQGTWTPSPRHPLPTSLTVSLLKALALRAAAAAAHSSDRLMNPNRRGFQSLDGAGEKPDAYSVDSPPIGLPAVYELSLTRL